MDKRQLLSDQDEASGEPDLRPVASYDAGASGLFNNAPAVATAPPADVMPTVPGYEGFGGEGSGIPPPYEETYQEEGQARSRHWEIPAITEELAQEVFIEYASRKCCYSVKPAKEMVFTDLQSLNTYRYCLETFTESRSTEWATEPYNGQVVNAYNGVAPGPWDMAVPVPPLFQDCKKEIRIPHTSSVKGCHSCLCLGRSACNRCITSGRSQCGLCNGSGRNFSNERCLTCGGTGRVVCSLCGGMGSRVCSTCQGKGQLLCFLKLKIKWKNNIRVTVVDKHSGFPIDHLEKVTGENLFTDMNQLVNPVVSFPDNAVNAASEAAVREHQAQFSTTCRILQQRQTIELIPVTRVHYSWKEKTHIYFVYGAEHKVYTKDYPVKCCCCSIL